ncbi:MAG TPA: hypothetical protein VF905_00410 [Nitrospirota bacterium]
MRGFASAQRQYENMEPANTECDCPELFECGNCGEFATEAKTCTECTEDGEPVIMFEAVERTERTEGELTDPRCNFHNHNCTSRDCCD